MTLYVYIHIYNLVILIFHSFRWAADQALGTYVEGK